MRHLRSTAMVLTLVVLTSAASVAQLKPPVATFTVPVTISNMDDERFHRVIGDLEVVCFVFGASKTQLLAEGSTKIDLVITPATTTSRAVANFNDNVVVTTYVARVIGTGSGAGDSETSDQVAARNAIRLAKTYRCELWSVAAHRAASGAGAIGTGDVTPATLTAKIGATTVKPSDPLILLVEGPLGK
jgi:hypothetical protein